MTDRYQFMIHFGTNTLFSDFTMYGKSKIQCSGPEREHFYITFWCVYINILCKKTGFKILEKIDGVVVFHRQYFTYLLEPFIKTAFITSTFLVFPMRRETFFCDLVHALGANLYFHPFPLRSHYSGMQGLVSI